MPLLIDSSTSSSSSSDQGNLDFQFKTFNENNASDFAFTENSTTHMRALQVTFDIGADSTAIVDASGQITYITPLHLWDPEYNYTASFNTSFLLNIGPTEDGSGTNTTGGGMAFMLSSMFVIYMIPQVSHKGQSHLQSSNIWIQLSLLNKCFNRPYY